MFGKEDFKFFINIFAKIFGTIALIAFVIVFIFFVIKTIIFLIDFWLPSAFIFVAFVISAMIAVFLTYENKEFKN